MSTNRRDSYRLQVRDVFARVSNRQNSPDFEVVDLSASGSCLRLSHAWLNALQEAPLQFNLGDYEPFQARVIPIRTSMSQGLVKVGVQFQSLDIPLLQTLTQFLVDRFTALPTDVGSILAGARLAVLNFERDPVRKLILYHTIIKGRCLRLHRDKTELPVRLRTKELTVLAGRQLILAQIIEGDSSLLETNHEYQFTFAGPNTLNIFNGTIWRIVDDQIHIYLPDTIRQVGFRDSLRTSLGGDASAEAIFDHPRLAGLKINKQIFEVGSRGFSFELDPTSDLLVPGDLIKRLVLRLHHQMVEAQAVIRSVFRKGQDTYCGLEIERFAAQQHQETWKEFVFSASHPRIEWGNRETIEDAWCALVDSGYIDLLEDKNLPQIRSRFIQSWQRHVDCEDLGRFFVLRKGNRPVGTAAASLLYPRTWMPHHFGIDQSERKTDRRNLFDYGREIYSGTFYLLNHLAPLDYFVFYFDSAKPFHEITFGQFLRRYTDKKDYIYDDFKLYKCQPNQRPKLDLQPTDSVRIVEADSQLKAQLAAHLQRTLPGIECDAMCYQQNEIDLNDFSYLCAMRGYERKRKIFVALKNNNPLCAMFAETGDEGINLFSLFNRCWFVHLGPRDLDYQTPQQHLLQHVLDYYARQGKSNVLLMDRTLREPVEMLEAFGFRYVANGIRWLARRGIVPAYINYVEELMGMAKDFLSK